MNEDDWKKCYAMFKSITGASAEECFRFANEMVEASKQKENDDDEVFESGIATVVPKRTYKRKG